MTFQEAMQYMDSLRVGGIRLGLDRLRHALALAGDPHRRLRVIHVAGTNGKGSTARMIQCILAAAGWRVGVFSSPAVTGMCDTVTLDGAGLTEDRFAALIAQWKNIQEDLDEAARLTEFELLTAVAFTCFAEERVDVCVLECGMGGRCDATNVCPPPLTAVFTPIDLDHTAFLGGTIEEIAREKSGIIKPPCAVITTPSQSPDALAVLFEEAAAHGLTVRQPNRRAATVLPAPIGAVRFAFDGVEYTLPLGGEFQVDNALTALETVRALVPCGLAADANACRLGLANATLPCREEVVCRTPLIVLDGAHNPHGMEGVAALLQRMKEEGDVTLLFGMLRDKDTAACVAEVAPHVARVVCCTPPNARALPAAQLAEQFAHAGVGEVYAVNDLSDAWEHARRLAADTPLFVGGSFYTASAIRPFACAFAAGQQNNV